MCILYTVSNLFNLYSVSDLYYVHLAPSIFFFSRPTVNNLNSLFIGAHSVLFLAISNAFS